MNPNLKPSDRAAVAGFLYPDQAAAATYTSGWIKASDFGWLLAAVMVGDMGASGTVDAKIEQGKTSAGTGAKDVTGAAITQFTQASADDRKLALINLDVNKLDRDNNFDYVRLSITVGVATTEIGGLVLGMDHRYGPASHITAVDEVKDVF